MNSREEILHGICEKKYDILIIGGGVIGAALAYQATQLGLKTILVEQKDYASGASSKSIKMLHGNMYAMNKKNINDVILALSERGRLAKITNADLMSVLHAIADGTPIFKKHDMRAFIYETLSLYKTPFHKFLSKNEVKKVMPFFDTRLIEGMLEYFEYSVNDIRFVYELIYHAKENGADIINHMKVEHFFEGEKNIERVGVKDLLTLKTHEIKAKNIVNAAGHNVNFINNLLKNKLKETEIDFVKATNIYVSQEKVQSSTMTLIEDESSTSKIYILPFKADVAMISMSDKRNYGIKNCIYSVKAEVDYIIDTYNKYFTNQICSRDIINTESAIHTHNKLSYGIREHEKYAYYSVDGASITLSLDIARNVLSSIAGKNKIIRKTLFHRYLNRKTSYLSEDARTFIIFYYGYSDILDRIENICKKDPSLSKTVTHKKIPLALIRYFALNEDAQTLNDMMGRRFQFNLTEDDYGIILSETVAEEMAKIHKWDENRKKDEISKYIKKIKRGRASLY